ncbi:glycosyltransferase family 2 protein [Mitsuaria sp. WAJ17]|uniref:glycosyltransferase family 2 protein n=1 Tax=Mitsuaria sp. WAJ17 TaxID=2761452 RepID=UPI001602885B|nr:glycosyltransferase family A protein [Mitsuaria sp. WAJ17]MBB2484239.1 glycosyltransferase family 2 protein [Mitsuaria sp. WAJ17]
MTTPLFTVFTPTYNRAHTLHRVHESLLAQTFKDFEWLIVDDGSTDATAALVAQWQQEGRLQIRLVTQANRGKHFAYNRGVREARGELFLAFDSDDSCVAETLAVLREAWLGIPEAVRPSFSGVSCLCRDEAGVVLGGPLPASSIDGHPHKLLPQLGRHAEMWGIHRTDILRDHPFPEFDGEKFVPEGLVWNRISRRYQVRHINQALRIYHDSADSLSRKMVDLRHRSPRGSSLYYAELLQDCERPGQMLRCAANLARYQPESAATQQAGGGVPLRLRAWFWAGVALGQALRWRDSRRAHAARGLDA